MVCNLGTCQDLARQDVICTIGAKEGYELCATLELGAVKVHKVLQYSLTISVWHGTGEGHSALPAGPEAADL